ncbi:TIGR03756 family integrating conjugative element protein, partial [Pseudomonas aeruginosa]
MEPRHHQPPGRGGGQALCGLWRAGCGSRCRAHRAAPEDPAVTRPFDLMRRLRAGVASLLLLSATGSYALNTATII